MILLVRREPRRYRVVVEDMKKVKMVVQIHRMLVLVHRMIQNLSLSSVLIVLVILSMLSFLPPKHLKKLLRLCSSIMEYRPKINKHFIKKLLQE